MNDIIEYQDQYYISVNSTYADDRTRVLNHTDTFGIFDRWGDVKQLGEEVQGIYHNGMRYLSDLEFRINGRRPLLLSSSVKEENEILSVDLTNPTIIDLSGKKLDKGLIHIGRSKFVINGSCYEQIKATNFGTDIYDLEISLSFNADFKDIFEVRGIKRQKRGEVYEIRKMSPSVLRICYLGLDNKHRISEVCFSQPPDSWENYNKAVFRLKLEPHQQGQLNIALHFLHNREERPYIGFAEAKKKLEKEVKQANAIIADVNTSNEQFNQWIGRSRYDLLSLLADTRFGKYPYAGVPWYNTAFGRDGIITALQTLWVAPTIARDVLIYLASTQATSISEPQDAEPGKIVHEVRGGEMVELNEIPFKQYYGSVDATPLFIVLAGAYYRRTADLNTIKTIWKNIEAALSWIDTYGDPNNDGFVEYHHKSRNGLTNQGWKDSFDSVSHENGRLADPPIALCEVQGYVYDAKIKAAMLAEKLGHTTLATRLQHEAMALRERFNEAFWLDDISCFALALDGNNKPCRVVSSNPGHCLYSGIVDEEKAALLTQRLMQPDMFSGWGIRTLSTREKRYNPMSYHNGSVWPHDVSLIAKGLARYGFHQQSLQLTSALFNASLFIDLQRLPELFCGFERRRNEGPTNYPVACSPQAWAVGAVYLLLDACLNMEIDAEQQKVYFRTTRLPDGINTIKIHHLRLGNGFANLEVYTDSQTVGVKVVDCPPGWQILTITET